MEGERARAAARACEPTEGVRIARAALSSLPPEAHPPVRNGLAEALFMLGDHEGAERELDAVLVELAGAGRGTPRVRALGLRGAARLERGDVAEARADLSEAIAIAHELRSPAAAAGPLLNRGIVELDLGRLGAARRDLGEAVTAFREAGALRSELSALGNLGLLDLLDGDDDAARRRLRRGAKMSPRGSASEPTERASDRCTRSARPRRRAAPPRA